MTHDLPPGLVLRPATGDDAEGCAGVHHAGWVDTYADLLAAEHWDDDTVEQRTAMWARWLDGGVQATVAEVDGELVGVAIGGPGRRVGAYEPVRGSEVHLLYVRTAHHGTGLGQTLLDAVVARGTPAQLWVAERNPRARRFYERNGFTPDGARHVDGRLGLAEVRMVR